MITSRQNPTVKHLAKLLRDGAFRRQEGEFVVEGIHLTEDALRSGAPVRAVILSEQAERRPEVRSLLDAYPDIERILFSDSCYERISVLRSPEGVAARIALPAAEKSLLSRPDARLIVLAGIQDPGNAGALVRTAEGAGMTGALFVGSCCDPTHPAYLRATMGACFRLPLQRLEEEAFLTLCAQKAINLAAAAAGSEAVDYRRADFHRPLALVIGAEGQGVPDAILSQATQRLSIPMRGQLESLNAAIAGALLMYEATRND